MYIHLRYGSEKEENVLLFDHNFVSVADVLHKAKKRYGKNARLILLNVDNICLDEKLLIEKGRSYRVKRQ